MNPAGNDVLYQDFKIYGTFHHWTELFDFSNDSVCWKTGLSPVCRAEKKQKIAGDSYWKFVRFCSAGSILVSNPQDLAMHAQPKTRRQRETSQRCRCCT